MNPQTTHTIVFQGDSITDAGRDRHRLEANAPSGLGAGYAGRVAAALLADLPDPAYRFLNRGVSGDRICNLRDRYAEDILALQPSLLSLLIGVNDTWHGVAKGEGGGSDLEGFEQIYRGLLQGIQRDLPQTRLVICEPFVLEAGEVLDLNFHPDLDLRRGICKALASEFSATFVPFQELFDKLVGQAPPAFWAEDGIHPTPAGHEAMAAFWMGTVALP